MAHSLKLTAPSEVDVVSVYPQAVSEGGEVLKDIALLVFDHDSERFVSIKERPSFVMRHSQVLEMRFRIETPVCDVVIMWCEKPHFSQGTVVQFRRASATWEMPFAWPTKFAQSREPYWYGAVPPSR